MSLLSPRCPKCHQGKLFASPLKLAAQCSSCGMDFSCHDTADGPTFFAILIVGFVVMTAAGLVEYHLGPPMWVHAALWIPLIFFGCVLVLRMFKALMIGWEYKTKRLGHE